MPLDQKTTDISGLWASADFRPMPSTGELTETKPDATSLEERTGWALELKASSHRVLEWYFECALFGQQILSHAVEYDPRRMGGLPVLAGTRFTIAQTLAELAETSGVDEVAANFELNADVIRQMLNGLSLALTRPFRT